MLLGSPHCFLLIVLFCSALQSACIPKKTEDSPIWQENSTARPLVVTTIAPYEFLLQELAGDHLAILNTSEKSINPHEVDLTPEQSIRLRSATLFLSLNPEEERKIVQYLGKETQVLEMWHGFPLLASSHEGEGHQGWNEHFWLNPQTLQPQITTLAHEITRIIPEYSEQIGENKTRLLLRCRKLTASLRSTIPELQGGKILSFHSTLAYFVNLFDAKEIFIESRGFELGANEILQLFQETEALSFPVLIYSPQFQVEKAVALAGQLGLQKVQFNPLQPDVFQNMEYLAAELAKTLH